MDIRNSKNLCSSNIQKFPTVIQYPLKFFYPILMRNLRQVGTKRVRQFISKIYLKYFIKCFKYFSFCLGIKSNCFIHRKTFSDHQTQRKALQKSQSLLLQLQNLFIHYCVYYYSEKNVYGERDFKLKVCESGFESCENCGIKDCEITEFMNGIRNLKLQVTYINLYLQFHFISLTLRNLV